MPTVTTTLVSGQNAHVGSVSSRGEYSVTVTSGIQGADGISVVSANVASGNLVMTLSDESTIDAGSVAATLNTSAQYTWSNSQSFTANVGVVGVIANGSIGSDGQVLTSNGSSTYWSTTANLSAYQTTAGLSANVATLSSNNASYLGGIAANQYAYANATTDHLTIRSTTVTLDNGANTWTGSVSGATQTAGIKGNSNTLFTMSGNSAAVMSLQMDGSLFVGDTSGNPAPQGVSSQYPGWIVAMSGIKSNYSVYGGTDVIAENELQSISGGVRYPDGTLQNTAYTGVTSNYTWTGTHTFSNTITFNGNINVNGNTNYFSSNNIVYTDSLVEIHAPSGNASGSWVTNDGNDIGFRFHYYNDSDKNAGLFMDNGTWRLKWVVDGSESGGQFTHTSSLGDIEANTVYANLTGTANNASYLGGTAAAGYQTTAGLSANVATLTSNNTLYLGGTAAASFLQTGASISVANLTATGNITGNTAGFAIGYLDVPQNYTNTSFTIALSDRGKHIYTANGTSQTITIANNSSVAFPIGSAISIVNQGAGTITVARGTGVSMYLAANSTSADRSIATYGMATILKVGTDTWFINGAGVS